MKLSECDEIEYYGTWLFHHNVMILEEDKTLRINFPTIVPLLKSVLDEILGDIPNIKKICDKEPAVNG